ncbi:hypothetical protein BDZ94DRAFT_1306504 [Collybia nuda]|uniref:Uncharacterized protein n=1 Tax=Collybia nuda TaxID=64659 RepID=A0A9P5YCF5_9AGAR|nr:hypothetical protein BDZ94DRAFT_1306504 [Collybia nuda]
MATTLTNPPTQPGPSRTYHPPDLIREDRFSAQSQYEDTVGTFRITVGNIALNFRALISKSFSTFSPSSPLYIIYGFGSSEIESDPENVISLSGPIGVALTAAERAREKKLRDDPMAIVLGPLFVDCKRCGARIKLSSKSQYDTLHWRTHRARCLKRQRRQPKKPGSGYVSLPSLSPPRSAKKVSPSLSEVTMTPVSLVRGRSQSISVPAITRPSSSSLPRPSRVRTADTIFEEYLFRSNRMQAQYTSQPPTHWKDWSWDQLLLPKFAREADTDQPDLTIGNNATLSPTHAALPSSLSLDLLETY